MHRTVQVGTWAHHFFCPVEGAVCFSRNATFPRGWMETFVPGALLVFSSLLLKMHVHPRELPTRGSTLPSASEGSSDGWLQWACSQTCTWHGFSFQRKCLFLQRVSRNVKGRSQVLLSEPGIQMASLHGQPTHCECGDLQRGFVYARISCFLAWLVLLLILLFFSVIVIITTTHWMKIKQLVLTVNCYESWPGVGHDHPRKRCFGGIGCKTPEMAKI